MSINKSLPVYKCHDKLSGKKQVVNLSAHCYKSGETTEKKGGKHGSLPIIRGGNDLQREIKDNIFQ